jgi:zinc transporter ZupT
MSDAVLFSLVIFLVAIGGGVVSFFGRGKDRLLHLFIGFACGVFLGGVFLHLLPELAAGHVGHDHASAEPGDTDVNVWFFVLVGVLGIYFFEVLLIRRNGESEMDQHAVVSYAAFFGLCIHAFLAGVGLAVTLRDQRLGWPLFFSMTLHKGTESFSLGSVFALSSFSRSRMTVLLLLFSIVTPAGILGGGLVMGALEGVVLEAVTALAAGTFLYVALCELLPEVFHHRVDVGGKICLLSLGVGLMLLMRLLA